MTVLEVIATTVGDAVKAEQLGADRLELVTGMKEGGLTPSYGLIKEVLEAVSIPVHVIIRPHSRSFVYTDDDEKTMIADIEMVRRLGGAGVVIGMLNEAGEIHETMLGKCLDVTGDMNVTFHRAIDEAKDIFTSIDVLNRYPKINRILTSGGKPSAMDAVDIIAEMTKKPKLPFWLEVAYK